MSVRLSTATLPPGTCWWRREESARSPTSGCRVTCTPTSPTPRPGRARSRSSGWRLSVSGTWWAEHDTSSCYHSPVQVYTSKSDVWSYGVLVWELVTLGAMPYPGVRPESLLPLFQSGYRMDRPERCPGHLWVVLNLSLLIIFPISRHRYKLMLDCWNLSPSRRPGFKTIKEDLEVRLLQSSNYLYLENEDIIVPSSIETLDTGSGYWTRENLRIEEVTKMTSAAYLSPNKLVV